MNLFRNLIGTPTRETRRELKDVLLTRDHNMLAALIQDFGAIQIIVWVMDEHSELSKKHAVQQVITHELKTENRKLRFENNNLKNTKSKQALYEHISMLEQALAKNTAQNTDLLRSNQELRKYAQRLTDRLCALSGKNTRDRKKTP